MRLEIDRVDRGRVGHERDAGARHEVDGEAVRTDLLDDAAGLGVGDGDVEVCRLMT